jgi:hypothetical protein
MATIIHFGAVYHIEEIRDLAKRLGYSVTSHIAIGSPAPDYYTLHDASGKLVRFDLGLDGQHNVDQFYDQDMNALLDHLRKRLAAPKPTLVPPHKPAVDIDDL